MVEAKEVLNKKELAEFLSISVSFLNKLMSEKKIPYLKIENKVLFLKSDILSWLESKRVILPHKDQEG